MLPGLWVTAKLNEYQTAVLVYQHYPECIISMVVLAHCRTSSHLRELTAEKNSPISGKQPVNRQN